MSTTTSAQNAKELLEKRMGAARIGGPGTVRRTVKVAHKNSTGDDKKVQNTLKRLGVAPVSEIDEAYFFKTDNTAMFFRNPKLQASMHSQCFVVSGPYETKSFKDIAPEVATQAVASLAQAAAAALQA
jgi:nascent polypeptide-associated complex subunit beta